MTGLSAGLLKDTTAVEEMLRLLPSLTGLSLPTGVMSPYGQVSSSFQS